MPPPLGFVPHTIPWKHFSFGATQSQYGYVSTQSNTVGFGPQIIPSRHYGFGSNQANSHYGFGSSYSYVYHQLPPIDFNTDISATLKEAGDIIHLTPLYSVPRQTILQLKQEL